MLMSQKTPKNVGCPDRRLHRRRRRARPAEYFGIGSHFQPGFDVMEDRVLLSTGPANPSANAPLVLPASVMAGAIPLTIGSTVSADLTGAGAAFYEIEAGSDGRLIAQVQADEGSLQLRLS